MRQISMVLAFVVFGGLVAFRVFNWGSDVKGYVDAEHRKDLVQISNTVVGSLNEATKSVEAMHALLRRATDPTENKRKGAVSLLGLSGNVVQNGIAEARKSVQDADLPSGEHIQELLNRASALLITYEGFIPVHSNLSKKILSASDLTLELTEEVRQTLVNLETQKTESIEAFTQAQHKFLR